MDLAPDIQNLTILSLYWFTALYEFHMPGPALGRILAAPGVSNATRRRKVQG
jgi:hypothetical protein